MLSYFEKLRQAPLRERRQAAMTLTFVVVAVVAVIWLVSLVIRIGLFPLPGDRAPSQAESRITPPY